MALVHLSDTTLVLVSVSLSFWPLEEVSDKPVFIQTICNIIPSTPHPNMAKTDFIFQVSRSPRKLFLPSPKASKSFF